MAVRYLVSIDHSMVHSQSHPHFITDLNLRTDRSDHGHLELVVTMSDLRLYRHPMRRVNFTIYEPPTSLLRI